MSEITAKKDIEHLKSLGNQKTEYSLSPSIDILETFKSPSVKEYVVVFEQEHNEFTSLCPKTGQPDFATFKISYRPDKSCVESKSLKVYLQSYRNSSGFGEAITNKIADDLFAVLQPQWIEVQGIFSPRGGIKWTTIATRRKKKRT